MANSTVANWKVFVSTWLGALTVYGLRESEGPRQPAAIR
jgi:hypothetical protein